MSWVDLRVQGIIEANQTPPLKSTGDRKPQAREARVFPSKHMRAPVAPHGGALGEEPLGRGERVAEAGGGDEGEDGVAGELHVVGRRLLRVRGDAHAAAVADGDAAGRRRRRRRAAAAPVDVRPALDRRAEHAVERRARGGALQAARPAREVQHVRAQHGRVHVSALHARGRQVARRARHRRLRLRHHPGVLHLQQRTQNKRRQREVPASPGHHVRVDHVPGGHEHAAGRLVPREECRGGGEDGRVDERHRGGLGEHLEDEGGEPRGARAVGLAEGAEGAVGVAVRELALVARGGVAHRRRLRMIRNTSLVFQFECDNLSLSHQHGYRMSPAAHRLVRGEAGAGGVVVLQHVDVRRHGDHVLLTACC